MRYAIVFIFMSTVASAEERFTEMNYGEQTFVYDRNGHMVAAGVGDRYGMYYSNRYGQTVGTRYDSPDSQ